MKRLVIELILTLHRYEFPTPQTYRDARRDGINGFKKPVANDDARLVTITGRDGESVEIRVISPTTQSSKGVWLHFHAGQHSGLFA